jgi:hypothetical protein
VSWVLHSLIEFLDLQEAEASLFGSVSPKEDPERLPVGERGGGGRDSPAQCLLLNNSRRTDHGGTRLHVGASDHH